MLSVAYDREYERQSSAGIPRYASALASALSRFESLRLVPIGGGPLLDRGTLRKRFVTARQDLWWYPFEGRRRARRLHADIYHCPSPRGPLTRGLPPLVVTIQDLASYRFPETLTHWTRVSERVFLPAVARAADLVIAPSSDSATDIEHFLKVPAARIRVIPLGVDEMFFDDGGRMESPYPFQYVLFVGTPQPRKNLERLVAAVDLLASRGSALRLVVAGSDGWGDVELGGSRVVSAGRVSDAQLVDLYRHAECLALVSLHEGFGFPILEAMATGTPVVASNVAAIPEVAGGCAVLVDPLNIESIADGLQEAITRRGDLAAPGRALAARRSWAATAALTLAVYRELA